MVGGAGAGSRRETEAPGDIAPAGPFWYAEDYHQQYLHKVPNGYCGLAGTGMSCHVGVARTHVAPTDR